MGLNGHDDRGGLDRPKRGMIGHDERVQTDRQTDRRTDGQTEKQIDRQADRQTRQTGQAGKQACKHFRGCGPNGVMLHAEAGIGNKHVAH